MNLCLDTNVFIELLGSRKPHYRDRLDSAVASGVGLKLSPIVLHELVLGARLSARPAYQMERVQGLVGAFEPNAWTVDDAIEAAGVRAMLQTAGTPIGPYDMMIAGQCLARDWTLVTANLTEFGRIQGLNVIDWSDPAGPIDLMATMARLRRRPSED